MARKAFTLTLILSALFSALLVVSLNAIIDKNRERFREEIQSVLGRPLTFDQLQLSLWDGLGLAAKNLRVVEDTRFAATPFIQTRELRMLFKWLPLFVGNIKIKKLVFDEPEIQIIRNEAGDLNISALTADLEEGKKEARADLAISAVRIDKGKVDYIDRSVPEPVEISIRNLDMELKGPTLTGAAWVKLRADLLGSQVQNMSVEGRVKPSGDGKGWAQYPLDLQMHIDPLPFSQLTRSVPFLRENISPYLDTRGPLTVQARLQGTIEKPQLSDLLLTGPFFGSTKNNLTATGELDFSRGGPWMDAIVKGKLVIDSVGLGYLKKIPYLQDILPAPLSSDGPLNVSGEIQGSLKDLKINTRIRAEESELRYGEWLKKAKGIPASMELKMVWQKERTIFEPSTLTLHNLKLQFSGMMDGPPDRNLTLRLRMEPTSLSGWEKLLPPITPYELGGRVQFDFHVERSLQDAMYDIQGQMDLREIEAKDKKGGRSLEKLNGRVSFRGNEASVENLFFRLGPSEFSLEAAVPDLSQPTIHYTLRSARLHLADLTGTADEMRAFGCTGDLQMRGGTVTLRGNLFSPDGILHQIPYRSLRVEIAWSPKGLRFKDLTFYALGGAFRAQGALEIKSETTRRFSLDSRIDAVNLKTLAAQKFPDLKEQIEGRLNLKAKLRGEGKDGSTLQENLKGEGELQIRNGTLKGLNLIREILSQVPGLRGGSHERSSHQLSRYSALLVREGTSFDMLKANFALEQGRVRSQDLSLTTPDYSIQGEGWIGLDKTVNWNARLVISPDLTRELVQEWKPIRTALDSQERIVIPFRLEGTLPSVQPKPELKGLAEVTQ